MLHDFGMSLDFLAALCTLLYIGRLLLQSESYEGMLCNEMKKRSLLNQHVRPKAA
ncbi:MAG: hypothetical protein J0M12_03675 [Deltaproteobacteria bacterium]|nr:hypothetical protein [Deltaproteobacteria bacterium]